jgi:hypothetical protein
MNDEPKLSLTWVHRKGHAKREPCLQFEVWDNTQVRNVDYGATFRVCTTPRCPCHTLCVHCGSLSPDGIAPPGPLRFFWIDVRKRAVEMTRELKADAETLHLSKIVSTGLTDVAWDELHDWFWSAKIEVIQTADIAKIDITDLPHADDGHMVPFVEVFPLGLSLNFQFENASWAADEQYCVQPGCGCTQAALSFLQLKDATGKKTTSLRDAPTLRYDYRSQASQELMPARAGMPATGTLLAALKAAYPSLGRQLELHHRIMRSLYARHYLGGRSTQQPRLNAPVPATSRKVDRNGPCPCGSGKKFKKCCGR